MSTPRVSENPTTRQHYAAQAALAAALASAIRDLGIDPTGDDYISAAAELAHEFSFGAVTLAADYYLDARELAGVKSTFSPIETTPWDAGRIAAYIETSVADIDEAARELTVESLAQRITLDAGTDDLFTNIEADREAKRWARVTRPGACSFCLMLAARGAQYRTEGSANFRAHNVVDGKGGLCRCDVEPLFGDAYEPPAHVRAAASLWSESTDGLSGADARNAFRRALAAERRGA